MTISGESKRRAVNMTRLVDPPDWTSTEKWPTVPSGIPLSITMAWATNGVAKAALISALLNVNVFMKLSMLIDVVFHSPRMLACSVDNAIPPKWGCIIMKQYATDAYS